MPKRITIENAELSIVFGQQAYSFCWVTSVVINDPRENVLANSPQGCGDGIVYRNGTTQPVATEMVVREVPGDLYGLMKDAFEIKNVLISCCMTKLPVINIHLTNQ